MTEHFMDNRSSGGEGEGLSLEKARKAARPHEYLEKFNVAMSIFRAGLRRKHNRHHHVFGSGVVPEVHTVQFARVEKDVEKGVEYDDKIIPLKHSCPTCRSIRLFVSIQGKLNGIWTQILGCAACSESNKKLEAKWEKERDYWVEVTGRPKEEYKGAKPNYLENKFPIQLRQTSVMDEIEFGARLMNLPELEWF